MSAPNVIVGIAVVAIALVEVAIGARLRIASRRRGGGLVIGSVVTASTGAALLVQKISLAPALVIAVVAQVLALLSLTMLLRSSSD